MNKPTATHINYYHICHRKLWLFANNIQMEHTSDLVAEGKLIAETTYPQRAAKYKELNLGFVKIDHYDPKNKVVHEIKKSKKMETAHTAQLKYYLWVLEELGIENVSGILEYPKIRRTQKITLVETDRIAIQEWITDIQKILKGNCPTVINNRICKKCAYCEFCYS